MLSIKKIYLYLVSTIALVIWVVGGIMLVNMALKTWVFTKADSAYSYAPTKADCTRPVIVSDDYDKNPPGMRPCTDAELAEIQQQESDRRSAEKQREAAQALSMILIAAPVWFFHWRLAKREQ